MPIGLGDTIKDDNEASSQNKAKAMFLTVSSPWGVEDRVSYNQRSPYSLAKFERKI
jgi:hypothetical protein